MPRASKYTPELVAQITRLIEGGTYAIDACMVVGISEAIYYKWLKEKVEFLESIKKARAKAISVRVIRINKAGQDGHWQADAWWLERVARDRFGRYPPKKPQHTNITLGFEPTSAFIQPSSSEAVRQRPRPVMPRKKVRN
jgi:hypothetical protein